MFFNNKNFNILVVTNNPFFSKICDMHFFYETKYQKKKKGFNFKKI